MILTAASLIPYLQDRALLDPAAIVDGDVRVVDSSRRHRNFKVLRRREPGLFVKQVRSGDAQTLQLFQREAACYWLAGRDEGLAALRGLIPAFHDYDPALQTLTIELLPEAESLMEHHTRLGETPVGVAHRLGEVFAAFHGGVHLRPEVSWQAVFPGALPAILMSHRAAPEQTAAFGPAGAWIVELVRRFPEVHLALDTLAAGWQRSTLIHGDVKWDNCLVLPDGAVQIIDWELADVGDPLWDVGSVFQSYLCHWVMSMPAGAPAADRVERAGAPLETMQPAMRAFWEAYAAARGIAGPEARRQLERALLYGAARLVQTAFETAVGLPQAAVSLGVPMVQLSANVFGRPRESVAELLGI